MNLHLLGKVVYVKSVKVGISGIGGGNRRMRPWGEGKIRSKGRNGIVDKSLIPKGTPPLNTFSLFCCNTECMFLLLDILILLCWYASREITVLVKYAEPGPKFRLTRYIDSVLGKTLVQKGLCNYTGWVSCLDNYRAVTHIFKGITFFVPLWCSHMFVLHCFENITSHRE